MLREQIIATNEVDRQNQQITDETLYKMADRLSLSASVTRVGVNHDATMMPMGKLLCGKVVNNEDGSLELRAVLDDFSEDYISFIGPDNEKLYFGFSRNDVRPFVDTVVDTDREIAVSLNPIDFEAEDFCEICKYVIESENGEVITLTKKALEPEVEIILTLAKYTFYYLLAKKTMEKTTDKLADKLSDGVVSACDFVKNIVSKIFSRIKEKRMVTYVINASEQPIELVIQCDSAEVLSCALDAIDDSFIIGTFEKFVQYLNGGIQKMQFLYNNQSGKWELNYMLSEEGQVIGTEKCYDKSVTLYRQLMNTPGAGFSIGAPVVYEVEEIPDA